MCEIAMVSLTFASPLLWLAIALKVAKTIVIERRKCVALIILGPTYCLTRLILFWKERDWNNDGLIWKCINFGLRKHSFCRCLWFFIKFENPPNKLILRYLKVLGVKAQAEFEIKCECSVHGTRTQSRFICLESIQGELIHSLMGLYA